LFHSLCFPINSLLEGWERVRKLMSRRGKRRQPTSVARIYADVNENRPSSYWDYEKAEFSYRGQEDYEVVKKIGRGRYSEVFEGVNVANNLPCVIKILKPVKKKKVKREIKILQNLCGGPNIITLLDVCRDGMANTTSLIFEKVEAVDYRDLYPKLTKLDVPHYLFQLLQALDYCHSQGIMHRDVKPQNIVFDPKNRSLRLIDWGLAEFYHSKMEYNVRVASRYFKGPELLVNLRDYDYSLDLWAVGCMLAGMIFQREPFFVSNDNVDQLLHIAKVLGSRDLFDYLDKYQLSLSAEFDGLIDRDKFAGKSWTDFISSKNRHLVSEEAVDLLSKLLQYDHQKRLTCREAMAHPFFHPVRDQILQERKGLPSFVSDLSSASSSSSSSASSSSSSQLPSSISLASATSASSLSHESLSHPSHGQRKAPRLL